MRCKYAPARGKNKGVECGKYAVSSDVPYCAECISKYVKVKKELENMGVDYEQFLPEKGGTVKTKVEEQKDWLFSQCLSRMESVDSGMVGYVDGGSQRLETPCGDFGVIGHLNWGRYLRVNNNGSQLFLLDKNIHTKYTKDVSNNKMLITYLADRLGRGKGDDLWQLGAVYKPGKKPGTKYAVAYFATLGEVVVDVEGFFGMEEYMHRQSTRAGKTKTAVTFPLPHSFASLKVSEEQMDEMDEILEIMGKHIYENLSVLEIVTADSRSYNMASKGTERFASPREYYNRVSCIYERFEKLDIGPKVENVFICDGGMVIITEYMPMVPNESILEEAKDDIITAINIMHKSGIIHGNLNRANIAFDLSGVPFVLSPKDAFYEEDGDIFLDMWIGENLQRPKKRGPGRLRAKKRTPLEEYMEMESNVLWNKIK